MVGKKFMSLGARSLRLYFSIHWTYWTYFSGVIFHLISFFLSWFGHVWRRPVKTPIRVVDQTESSPIDRGRGRPIKIIGATIKRDLLV